MPFAASNAEPLAPEPRLALSKIWVDINDKKLLLEMNLALDIKNICHYCLRACLI